MRTRSTQNPKQRQQCRRTQRRCALRPEQVKTTIDAVELVPKDQRKPSTYITAATAILAALGPLADKVEADLKD